MVRALLLGTALLAQAAMAVAQPAADAASPPTSPVSLRIKAEEARQGAASDGTYVYAIDNDRIGKYRIADGRRVAQWQGERRLYPHMNSCTLVGTELVCAASNYPAVPQTSAVEIFDTTTMQHVRSVSLGFGPGSLTALDWHDGAWWAAYANYDNKGGEPGRDHHYTMMVQMDRNFRPLRSWAFPAAVLARMAPYSCSGMSWGEDGLIYATGHDRPEVYVLRLPEAGSVLELATTLGIATPGQAIDWDPKSPRRLWSIGRGSGEMVASEIPRP